MGWVLGVAAHTVLDLVELWRLSRAWPGGIPADAVPEHLRRHVNPVSGPLPPAYRKR